MIDLILVIFIFSVLIYFKSIYIEKNQINFFKSIFLKREIYVGFQMNLVQKSKYVDVDFFFNFNLFIHQLKNDILKLRERERCILDFRYTFSQKKLAQRN